ncbi:hypothetical protein EC973_002367 [Apophysomyces ossiformis]|uniref:Signal recognition particle receptor subunit beta n=1 Tax=Apophysomyces ossiformis TaxID=679940 RepID=A0A8H7BIE8_9FUNG|nr:hypothetical protein EC973_002367 [Apophysomyces ossiformis]
MLALDQTVLIIITAVVAVVLLVVIGKYPFNPYPGLMASRLQTCDLVDMPGHERVRYRFSEFLPVTRAIIFVVDSSTVSRSVRSVAEYLYNILAHPQTQNQRIPVLIACNKSDKVMALPKERIQRLLETEMNRLRDTRTAAVDQQASEMNEQEAYLGFEGEDFQFSHLENEVSFETCSVEKEELEDVTEWLRTTVFA